MYEFLSAAFWELRREYRLDSTHFSEFSSSALLLTVCPPVCFALSYLFFMLHFQSKRSFMADDGTKFAWDEEKGDWKQVEGDEEEELEDEEEEVCPLNKTHVQFSRVQW